MGTQQDRRATLPAGAREVAARWVRAVATAAHAWAAVPAVVPVRQPTLQDVQHHIRRRRRA